MRRSLPDYKRTAKYLAHMPYPDLRVWRNRLTRDLENQWVYRHATTFRTPYGDRTILGWINAEMARRIFANPLITSARK